MTEPSPEVQRLLRQTNILVWFVVIGSVLIAGGIGFAVAMATRGKPQWESTIHIGTGLLFLTVGLVRQFQLGVYGPKLPTLNRVQESVMNSAMVLLGVTQFAHDSVIETPLAILALVLVLAAAFRRPRKFF